jgi:spore coat polysaccharide biosynthesis protein SpsF
MVTCIVQARMGSERLPGKVLREVLGIPLILLNLNRLKKSRKIDRLILATSDRRSDNPLYDTVKKAGFEVFRGDEENVLKRYRDCVLEYGGDIVVRVTGDCPLIDPDIVDNVISHYKMYDYDYVGLDVAHTFVRGFDTEVFSREALQKTFDLAEEYRYKEHVTLYMYSHPKLFHIGVVRGEDLFRKNYRLCVDTLEDFTLVEKVFEHFGDIYVPARDVVKFLDSNPDIAAINSKVKQKEF